MFSRVGIAYPRHFLREINLEDDILKVSVTTAQSILKTKPVITQ